MCPYLKQMIIKAIEVNPDLASKLINNLTSEQRQLILNEGV
jgi:hypothetical protein